MELTNEEKQVILSQHIKNISTNIYNLKLSLLTENALDEPDSNNINNLNNQIKKESAKKEVLVSEYVKIKGDS
jgi:hypothetical protein